MPPGLGKTRSSCRGRLGSYRLSESESDSVGDIGPRVGENLFLEWWAILARTILARGTLFAPDHFGLGTILARGLFGPRTILALGPFSPGDQFEHTSKQNHIFKSKNVRAPIWNPGSKEYPGNQQSIPKTRNKKDARREHMQNHAIIEHGAIW